jgi:zinc protease
MDHFQATRAAKGMHEFKHKDTGLTLLLVPLSGLQVTTANITYHVGSRNEGLGVRGATHYLEHGMFKGSKKFNKKLHNGMWKLEEFGAYMNATTYTDRTNYFSVIESDKLIEVIKREADRMYEPLLDACELKKEMTVVRNEFERGENNDFEVLQKRVMATAFMAHPYHHSTIGWKSEIENVTAEALRKFHDTFYKPSNATYTFVGNFDSERVMQMVHDEFSKFNLKDLSIPDMYTTEPMQYGQRRVVMERNTRCALMCISFKAPNGLHEDAIVLEVIARMISHGPLALAKQYKEANNSVHDIIAEWERMRDPYLFSIWGTTNVASTKALQETEEIILEITKKIKEKNLKNQMDQAKTSIKNDWSNELQGSRKTAMAINEAIARGDAFDVYKQVEILETVTPEDIKRVAKRIFDTRRSTVGYLYPSDKTPVPVQCKKYPRLDTKITTNLPKVKNTEFQVNEGVFTEYDGKTDIRISYRIGDTLNDFVCGKLLAGLFTKGFNRVYTEKKIYKVLQSNNIQRQYTCDGRAVHLQASAPSGKPSSYALKLCTMEMKSPTLEAKTLEYLKGKWTAEACGSKNNVNKIAKILLFKTLFYETDPNYMYSTDELTKEIRIISHTDIKEYHKTLLDSPKIVTIVGKEVLRAKNEGKKWIKTYQNACRKASNTEEHIDGKSSCVLKYGMALEVQNYEALKLAVAVLGNGFTGRLMKIVRDEHGLTYGINAKLCKVKGCCVFEVTGTFSPKLLKEGIKQTEIVIKKWLEDTLTEEEIMVQQTECVGAQMVQYDAPGALASAIQYHKIVDSVDNISNYKGIIMGITPEVVNEAKKKITWEKLCRVKVGTLK